MCLSTPFFWFTRREFARLITLGVNEIKTAKLAECELKYFRVLFVSTVEKTGDEKNSESIELTRTTNLFVVEIFKVIKS